MTSLFPRIAKVFKKGVYAGILSQQDKHHFTFEYDASYSGSPISLTMPVSEQSFKYNDFPPFFDGLLPEGSQLDALLKSTKIDKYDYLKQLITVGADLVGDVTVSS